LFADDIQQKDKKPAFLTDSTVSLIHGASKLAMHCGINVVTELSGALEHHGDGSHTGELGALLHPVSVASCEAMLVLKEEKSLEAEATKVLDNLKHDLADIATHHDGAKDAAAGGHHTKEAHAGKDGSSAHHDAAATSHHADGGKGHHADGGKAAAHKEGEHSKEGKGGFAS
jgi:hypothetical protein